MVLMGMFTPLTVAILSGMALFLVWMAFVPASRPARGVNRRLEDYLTQDDLLDQTEMSRPLMARLVWPLLRRLLRLFGTFMPQRSFESVGLKLIQAGEPGHLTVLDFYGIRLLLAVSFASVYFFFVGQSLPLAIALRNTTIAAAIGYMLPLLWLRQRVRSRQRDIRRQMPDALDMLTISVEAGLAFESAMLRVGENWDNALSAEFRRVVGEIRMGTARNTVLQRMADRAGVDELSTFVAVLIQSNQLGVSIAQVLHSQAEQMRTKRRQMAEEQARQAAVKMVLVLVLLVFPVMFIAILGPIVPRIMEFLGGVSA